MGRGEGGRKVDLWEKKGGNTKGKGKGVENLETERVKGGEKKERLEVMRDGRKKMEAE